MTVKQYVDDVLCVPVTRIGNKYIIEAIEFVIDTKTHKFYDAIATIHRTSPRYLEKAMRDAKNLGLKYMNTNIKQDIFGKVDIPTSVYILKSAEYYRRIYENENKES